MIDIHSHVLPAVDDGAADWDAALALCQQAFEDGTEVLVVTPHQRHARWPNDDRAGLRATFDELRQRTGDRPRLLLGAELAVDSGLLDDVDRMPAGALLPIQGTRSVLIEFPFAPVGPEPRAIVHELVLAGWQPILAHPERISWLAGDIPTLRAVVERGARLQVTAMSVTGGFGKRAQSAALAMIDDGLVAFVASDAHHTERRPAGLGAARAAIAGRWGESAADALLRGNAITMLGQVQ